MHKPQATLPPLRRLRVITYRVTLDVPLQLVIKVSNLLRKRRKELGTRNGTRALTCYQQAVFILAWFRDRPGLSRLGQGFRISQATAYRYRTRASKSSGHWPPPCTTPWRKPLSRDFPT
jgi:hypothetical protein